MKKMTFLACATLLTSAVAFTSCNNDQNGPVGSQEQKDAVKTEFAIAIPEQATPNPNKMPSTNVPENGTFAGMKNIALIPFASPGAIVSGDVRLGSSNIAGITDFTSVTATGNAKVYENISIPLTTASFLVYAEATAAAAAGADDATKHNGGRLVPTGISDGVPAGISFDLNPVLANLDAVYSDADGKAAALLALLNKVAKAKDGRDQLETPTTPKQWNAYTSGDDAGMVAMWETYKTMHALSSFEVLRVLSDLYKSVEPLKTGAAEPVKTLAQSIQDSIALGVTVSRDGGGNITGFALQTDPFDYTGYPANLNIPDGSVRIKYDDDDDEFKACAAGDYTTQTNPALFTYPASLWYYANSTIKTANQSMMDQLTANKAWTEIIADYTGQSKPAAVNSLTRSVAIVNPIQYAVGRLDVYVKLNGTEFLDGAGQTIELGTGNFPLSAVLIGNQRRVLFNFKPDTISDSPAATKYTIYDNVMRGSAPINITNAAFGDPQNSTFVLETPTSTAEPPATTDDANADVQIAIELTNNSQSGDFIGANGQLIPAGGKFYLVGTMKGSAATETNKKVFKQDYLTKARLTITSLAGAYNEIPDLRTPRLELGMSVDLSWQTGHTYDVNFE